MAGCAEAYEVLESVWSAFGPVDAVMRLDSMVAGA